MKLLSHLSQNGHALPLPADARRLALGFSAWEAALAEAQDESRAALARQWSTTAAGRDLLAAIFGNSPFLSGVAIGCCTTGQRAMSGAAHITSCAGSARSPRF